jgi:anti-sigma-K factor RskA
LNETTTAAPAAATAPVETPRERDPRVRAMHRRVLLAIAIACVLLAAIGYVYARWLMTQPLPLKIPGH